MKTASEIAAEAFPFDGSDADTVIEARKRVVAAVEAAREDHVYKPVVVITRNGSDESAGIDVIDVDAFYDSPSSYDEDDVESMIERLTEAGFGDTATLMASQWVRYQAEQEEEREG